MAKRKRQSIKPKRASPTKAAKTAKRAKVNKKTPKAAKRGKASRAAKRAKAPTKAAKTTKRGKVKKTPKAAKRGKAAKRVKATKTSKRRPAPVAEAEVKAPAAVRRRVEHSYATAEGMAKSQRHISVSEFFAKNRHLLGFDNPRKALLTTIKEAVDNSLDACEEAGIAPVIELHVAPQSETVFRVTIRDNGPGIVKQQIPNIFGRLLYGSKFHAMKMARGQQGIGISAAGMYGLLTTGQNIRITSRTGPRRPAHHYELRIDTKKNRPDVICDEVVEVDFPHGTEVAIDLLARYQKGRGSIDEYLQQTAIANPHAKLVYHAPDGRECTYDAVSDELPAPAKAVRPHPYGVELGVLIKMLHDTKARTLHQFLTAEFSRVSPRVAGQIIATAGLGTRANPRRCARQEAHKIHEAIAATKIMAPSTSSVVPIGPEQLLAGLRQVVPAAYYTALTRRPAVYRGNPFIVEAALAYGHPEGSSAAEAAEPADEQAGGQSLVKLIRFANRVPLLYQQSAGAIYKSVVGTHWKSYGLAQSRGALPSGPATIVVHLASIWVPFTSESKEAIADYPEIAREIRLALQECGRQLGLHIRRQVRHREELKKRSYIEKYIPHIGIALGEILGLSGRQVAAVDRKLTDILQRSRKL